MVFRQCVYQTVQLLGMLGRKQVAFVDGTLHGTVDIFIDVERPHLGAARFQLVADRFGRCMVAEACGDG